MSSPVRGKWIPWVAAVAAFALFIKLGFWQIDRAATARLAKTAYLARVAKAPVAPPADLPWPVGSLRYRRLKLTGRYDPTHTMLLDNQVHHGQAGYDVLTPLKLTGGDTRVLVNRGWIPLPAGDQRAILPAVATPTRKLTLVGLAVQPGRYFRLGRPAPPTPFHERWEYLDLARYQKAVPFPVAPLVVLLAPDAPHGFVRDWPAPGTGVTMHDGYALQWFLFAAAVVVITFVMNRPRTRHGQ